MIVIVCGGRDWRDETYVHARLNVIHATSPITEVHQGGFPLARTWAERKGIPCFEYRCTDLVQRNWEMLRIADPETVIAFSGGRGDGVENLTALAATKDIHIINLQKGMTNA